MNKEWSIINKDFQKNLTHDQLAYGIDYLLKLREELFNYLLTLKNELKPEDFHKQPFMNHDGYDSKSIAYSIYHIFRIEDIVLTILINAEDSDLFKMHNYKSLINISINTTGNELFSFEIYDVFKNINIDKLYEYITLVYNKSNTFIKQLTYSSLKIKYNDIDKERIINAEVVSSDLKAIWLIDYWSNKNLKDLLKMPFSRHWIMHIEAINRIKSKLI